MVEWDGRLSECPPCGADSLLPLCRALAVGSWGDAPVAPKATADSTGDSSPEPTSDPYAVAGQVFSVRRPRDALAGAASGLKTTVRSVAAGVAALANGPLDGLRSGGAPGFLLGLGGGAASAVLLPCVGVLVGTAQCARGVANTPIAVVESWRGLVFCPKERRWVLPSYSLQGEAEEVERRRSRRRAGAEDDTGEEEEDEEQRASGRGRGSHVGTVQRHGPSPCFYEILQVQPTASAIELRKAYYRESRRCHPDKAGASNPSAVAQFQQLAEAYKVLRSPDLRRAYDAGGHEAVERLAGTVDLGLLYAMVLGGEHWEPYVGRLALSRILGSGGAGAGRKEADPADALADLWCAGDAAVSDQWQVAREVACAVALAEKLQSFVDERGNGGGGAFAGRMAEEAGFLAHLPYAPAMLAAIAQVYESEADRFLRALRPWDPRWELSGVQGQSRLAVQQLLAVVAGVRAAFVLSSLAEESEAHEGGAGGRSSGTAAGGGGGGGRPAGAPRAHATNLCLERPAVQAGLPTLALALWRLTVLDLEGTLRRVCRRVLRDASCDFEDRVRRAHGLKVIAAAFRTASGAEGVPGQDAPLLLQQVRQAAAHLASGSASTPPPPMRAGGAAA